MAYGYRQTYQLRTGDFDRHGHVKPSAILDVCQDCAGQNAESMPGMDFESMSERGLIWVVTRLGYEVCRQPQLHEQVEVETWPLAPTRKGFQREYRITSLDGETLAVGSSEWVIMSFVERTLVSGREFAAGCADDTGEDEGGDAGMYRSDTVLDWRLRKLAAPEGLETVRAVRPGESDIDVNGHVNNARYADWGLDALSLGAGEAVTRLQIDFRHELLEGEELHVAAQRDGGAWTVVGSVGAGEEVRTSFVMRAEVG